MITRDRRLLEQIVKQWAQDHTFDYEIADYASTQEALELTGGHLAWAVQEGHVKNLDFLSLVDRLEMFLETRRKRRHPDGMLCTKCNSFYEFAEPNQEDGSLICYSCRNNPYR